MDLRTLTYFVVIAEELNITKAAKILNMSQPPLSNQMKGLEEELGTKLFIRGKRQLTLTEEGKYLYQKSKDILGLVDKTTTEIRDMNNALTGTISIGLVEGIAPDIAAQWISDYMRQYPSVHFRVVDGNSDDLIEKMRAGLISLAVVTAPIDANLLNSIKVGEEKLGLFMNKDHPLASTQKNITIHDIRNEPLIVPSRKATSDYIRKWFRPLRVEPNIVCEMDNYLDAAALAGRSVGISVFPRTGYILNSSIVRKEIEGVSSSIEYYFVWRKGHMLSVIEENFIDYIQAIVTKK